MKNGLNTTLKKTGIIFLLLLLVLSSGCIKSLLADKGEDKGSPTLPPEPGVNRSSSGNIPITASITVSPHAVVTTPPDYIEVAGVDPRPYVTSDPYAIPYRDHGNWSNEEPARISRIPQFTKTVILRSNATAFQVNVTRGPLVIDLTYSPLFSNPDQTKQKSDDSDSNDDSGSTENIAITDGRDNFDDSWSRSGYISNSAVATNSFVSSNAEVSVLNEISNGTVAQEGYGGIYSTDLHKQITIYREGPYIITLTGNFIDVNIAITTGSAREVVTPAPTSGYTTGE